MKKFEGNGLIKVGIEVVSLLILVVIKGSSEQVNQPAVCLSQLISSSFICLQFFWSYRRSVLAAWFGRSLTLLITEACHGHSILGYFRDHHQAHSLCQMQHTIGPLWTSFYQQILP